MGVRPAGAVGEGSDTTVVHFAFKKGRVAVLVVDMQNEFVEADGLFAVPGAVTMAERMAVFLAEGRRYGLPVIFTAYKIRSELPGTSVSAALFEPVRRRTAHTGHHAEIHTAVLPLSGDIVVEKRRQSGFFATDLEVTLRTLGVETVIVCGLTTNVCCLATARDAAARDFRVVFLSDLTATFDLPAPGGGTVPAGTVQAVTCAIVAHSIGEVTTSGAVLTRLAEVLI